MDLATSAPFLVILVSAHCTGVARTCSVGVKQGLEFMIQGSNFGVRGLGLRV